MIRCAGAKQGAAPSGGGDGMQGRAMAEMWNVMEKNGMALRRKGIAERRNAMAKRSAETNRGARAQQ